MFVLLVGLAVALLPVSQAFPSGTGPRIINGSDADIHDYPYIVSIRLYGDHYCGGSIIDEYNILTAAHCTKWERANLSVVVGSTNLTNDGPFLEIENILVHESNYGWWPYPNDVALLQLVEPLEFGETVQPIQLPKALSPTPELSTAILTGWGQDQLEGPLKDTLQQVNITVYSDSDCETAYAEGSGTNRVYQLCAGEGTPEGKGQCYGDSGGPLAIDGVQIGIVSWSGGPCTTDGYPGVFTKVSTYVDWITCHLKKE